MAQELDVFARVNAGSAPLPHMIVFMFRSLVNSGGEDDKQKDGHELETMLTSIEAELGLEPAGTFADRVYKAWTGALGPIPEPVGSNTHRNTIAIARARPMWFRVAPDQSTIYFVD